MRCIGLLLLAASLWGADLDRDGLDDALEQKLLRQFLPVFLVSGGECDVAPAEFVAGAAEPRVAARNGTIYGQVLRRDAARVEVHYYHLWGRDCGARGHDLDAEHVSALVRLDGVLENGTEARAEFWYAAAHEDTLCSSGSAARAVTVEAETRGPKVWISRGKHGSFLSAMACRKGCGGDKCEGGKALAVAGLVNIGEPGAAMNGATWAGSVKWPLRAKMGPDFDEALVGRLAASDGVLELRGVLLPAQEMISGGGRAVTEVGGAQKRTTGAVVDAEGRTEKAISGSKKAVKDWLKKRF